MGRAAMLVAALVLFTGGCGSDATEPGPGDGGGGFTLPNGWMRARIDGAQWEATALVNAFRGQTLVTVGGGGILDGQALAIAFTLSPVTGAGTGTYVLGPGHSSNANIGVAQTSMWWAGTQQGSGTVTITTLNDTRVAGTFAFTAVADPGTAATGTRTVTDGEFDIQF